LSEKTSVTKMRESSGIMTSFESLDADFLEQELAGESAVRRLFALTRRRYRELQRDEGLSQQDLAARMNLKPAQISRWFANPSNMTVRSAAKVLMAMGRKLELAVSDPFALAQPAHQSESANASTDAPAGIVLQFSDFHRPQPIVRMAAGSKKKLAMDAKTGAASSESDSFPELEPPVEFDRVRAESGEVVFLAWRSIVFVALTNGEQVTKLVLGDEEYDVLPASGALHVVGELSRADAAMFAERHREDHDRHPVHWKR
jgi:transcriptional regulator with XRE-family HTH domain